MTSSDGEARLASEGLETSYHPQQCPTGIRSKATIAKMDTHIADEKLKQLHVEDITVRANDRKIERYEIDPEAEKKLLRKLDLRVVPMLWFLYMLAFLDRSNIGMYPAQNRPDFIASF